MPTPTLYPYDTPFKFGLFTMNSCSDWFHHGKILSFTVRNDSNGYDCYRMHVRGDGMIQHKRRLYSTDGTDEMDSPTKDPISEIIIKNLEIIFKINVIPNRGIMKNMSKVQTLLEAGNFLNRN